LLDKSWAAEIVVEAGEDIELDAHIVVEAGNEDIDMDALNEMLSRRLHTRVVSLMALVESIEQHRAQYAVNMPSVVHSAAGVALYYRAPTR
jgi:hypothetical protein